MAALGFPLTPPVLFPAGGRLLPVVAGDALLLLKGHEEVTDLDSSSWSSHDHSSHFDDRVHWSY